MAKAGNSSSEEPPLNQRQAEHNFNEAARHCYEIIQKGRAKAVDQPRWAYEAGRWSEFVRPALDKAFAKCERAGMHTGDLRTRIKRLDTEYKLVCELRDATPSLTPDTAPRKRTPWRAIVFQPYLAKLFPPDGNVPATVTTPQAYKNVTAAMRADGKKDADIPADETFARFINRAKTRPAKKT
jgi:hypothetical protein